MKAALASALVLSWPSVAMPERPYFQQELEYSITVELDPESATLAGSEFITYRNNSLDTLEEVYFHLYYNAFQPGSNLDKLLQDENDYWINSLNPKDMGFINIELLRINGQDIRDYQVDNTIMRVPLPSVLVPGGAVSFYVEFRSQIPTDGFRAAHRGKHFDAAEWYPKPALYDRHGWHANQYLPNSEFFADFAVYDVQITLPSKYIVAHSGKLLNEAEIFGGLLPVPEGDSIIVDALKHVVRDTATVEGKTSPAMDTSRENSAGLQGRGDGIEDSTQPAGESSPQTIVQVRDTKTWKIRVENVHDFVFCADPDFTIDICRYKDTIIKSYYTGDTRERWEAKAAEYTERAIELFSERYFPYPYGQFSTVASIVSSGGMEYPQLVMIGPEYTWGALHSHKLESVIAHEAGHNWFQGILAFNETEEAFLDEGLTSFATIEYMEHYYGRRANNFAYPKVWQRKLLPNGDERNDAQKLYIQKALLGGEDPMDTPANLFEDWPKYYNASYEKAASVYFMLQYTLGNDGFRRFLTILFERWPFRHPYLSDVQEIAEEVYGGDLRWFFRQWFTTTWTLDYAVTGFSKEKAVIGGKSDYQAAVSVENRGRCISPLDLAFYLDNGAVDTARIPVSEWTDGQHQYDTTVFLGARPWKVIINPDLRLADVDRLNNGTGMFPVRWQFMVPRFIYPDNYVEYYVESYTIAHNPTLWYNSPDGVKIGYSLDGSYLGTARSLKLRSAFGLQDSKVNYELGYNNRWFAFDPKVVYYVGSRELEGRGRQEIGLRYESEEEEDAGNTQADISLSRNYLYRSSYLFGDGWSRGSVNTVDLTFAHRWRARFYDLFLQGSLSSSVPWSDYDFSRVAVGFAVFMSGIGVGESHLFLKAGRADGSVPIQRRFYLSSADPYDTWESPLYRSRGTLPDRWKKDGHLFKPGGAGLAGYYSRGLTGTRMLSVRISNDLPRLRLPIKVPILGGELRKVLPEIYFAGGYVWERGVSVSADSLLWEGGLALTYQIPYLDRVMKENRLGLYFPLWLSEPGRGQKDFKWRWLVSFTL